MPILNYTTKISASKTVSEIQQKLAQAGAAAVNVQYEDGGNPIALTFVIEFRGQYINYRLPSRWEGVHRLLQDEGSSVRPAYRTEEHARRVAWRIVKDWTEAQLAIVEAEVAQLPEVFLPYALHPETGNTLFYEYTSGERFLTDGR